MNTPDHMTDQERADMTDADRGHLVADVFTEALIANRTEAVALRDVYGSETLDQAARRLGYRDAAHMDEAAEYANDRRVEEHLEREAEGL